MRTIIIYLWIITCITKSLTDYTFYFQSYHYTFSNNNTYISNNDITIQFNNKHNVIIDNNITLNFLNDSLFNEINLIIDTTSNNNNNNNNNNNRQLLWNKWDHTKSRHLKKGRFIGDASKLRTFEDARSLCREYYGDIATIQSIKENKDIQDLCKEISIKNGDTTKSCWIGLTQPYYEWENGQYVSYSNWDSGKPTNSIDEKCSFMQKNNGKWDDYPCNRELYAICEKPIANYHGNYVVVSKQTTKRKAQKYCKRKFGSTLATILTPTDAIEAHEACKMVAKAPHGCWIGLQTPFKKWDNGLTVQSIQGQNKGSNMDWKGGKIPIDKELACVEMDPDGYWRGIPCDYERHIICNIHGVDTRQSEQDKEFLEKQKEAEKQKKLKEKELETQKRKQDNTEDKNENNIEGGNKGNKVDPSSPIEKQIEVLKKILRQQQERLAKEKAKFEGQINGKFEGGLHKLSMGEGMQANQHIKNGYGNGNGNDPMQGLKDEIKRLQNVNNGRGMGEIQSVYGLGKQQMGTGGMQVSDGDRMGKFRRQARMQQRIQQAGGNGGNGGAMNPFGGAFGGNLNAMVGNPYQGMSQSPQGRGQPQPQPQQPMNYGQYAMMMNKMNPLGLPRVSQGLYANRRLMSHDDDDDSGGSVTVKEVKKCVWGGGKEICIGYDDGDKMYSIDVRVCMTGGDREWNGKGDSGYIVYKYENICDDSYGYVDDFIQYLLVYEFSFEFDDDDGNDDICRYYGEYNVCMNRYDRIVKIYVSDEVYVFDYNNDYQWNEIYIGDENKKCVYVFGDENRNILCLIEDNVNKYRLEMKFKTDKLLEKK